MRKSLFRLTGLVLVLMLQLAAFGVATAAPAAATVPVTITGVTGDISVDPGAGFAAYYLRHVGNPPPAGYDPAHNYQWATPAIFLPSPEVAPVTLTGTIDVDQQVVNKVAMIGLLDQADLAAGNSGWQDGAYIYVVRTSATEWKIAVSDGNAGGGELIQTSTTIFDTDLPADGVLNVTFTVDGTADGIACAEGSWTAPAGCMTLQVTGGSVNVTLTDSYGDVVGNSSAVPEFSGGAVPGWDDFLASNVGYSLTMDVPLPVVTTIKNVHPLGTTTAVPAPSVCASGLIDNWSNSWFACDENSANATGGVAAVFGPATPPLGSGSAQFTIGENPDGPFAITPFEPGLPFSQLTQATYDTYWDSGDGADDRPYFFFNVDYDLTDSFTSWQGRLIWVPDGCVTTTANVWETLDPFAGDACWRQTGTPVVGDTAGPVLWPNTGSGNATWSQVLAAYPDAGIHSGALAGVGFKMGSGHAPSVVALDALTLGVNTGVAEEVTIYNFETPPTVDPVGDTEVCDAGTVDIQIDDVEGLYGYEFIVEYDETLVSAVGFFDNNWFDPGNNGFPGPAAPVNWQADCDDVVGECRFAYTRGTQDPELATAIPETIASIDFTTNPPNAAGTFDVTVKDVKLTDKDSFEISGAVGGTLSVDVCGEATVSGKISLQGRPQPGRPVISEVPAVFSVTLTNGPYGPYTAVPNPTDGTFTITGVKYAVGGTTYDLQADHSVYLMAEKSLLVDGNKTGQNTRLLGGDANDDGHVYMLDLTCIGGQFGSITPPFTCNVAPETADVNDDFKVNIQDLSLAAGNYNLFEPQGW